MKLLHKLVVALVTIALLGGAALGISTPLQAQEVQKVGTNITGAPWSFHDAASNTERGVSIDLIMEIGNDVGFQIRLFPMALEELIPALIANKIDIIAANLLITPERSVRRWSTFQMKSPKAAMG